MRVRRPAVRLFALLVNFVVVHEVNRAAAFKPFGVWSHSRPLDG